MELADDAKKGRHKKEIYDYESPHLVYGMGWSVRKDHSFRLALGSFVEDYANQVDIIELVQDPTTDDWKFEKTSSFEHPYPTTKIMWRPDEQGVEKDQLATTGDYLRLWDMTAEGAKEKAVFNNVSSVKRVRNCSIPCLFLYIFLIQLTFLYLKK